MGYADDINHELAIINQINNPVVTDPNSIPLFPFQLRGASRAWFLLKIKQPLPDPPRNK